MRSNPPRTLRRLLAQGQERLRITSRQPQVIRPDASTNVLRVNGVGGGREPDQITEQDRDDLPLLRRRSRLLRQRRNVGANGASRTRTGDLLGAIQALSQLSYSP